MEYTDNPTIFLEAEVEKAIKRALRNERRRAQAAKKAKAPVRRYNRKGPKPEIIMNDPLIMNA